MKRVPEATAAAFDALFASRSAELVASTGDVAALALDQWRADPDPVDRALFIDACDGPTLDVGCGPGRLLQGLLARDIPALGIDVSGEAIRQTRSKGGVALRRDVFDAVPGQGRWDFALLADGNVGIGGEPVRLLRRVRQLLQPRGVMLVEVSPQHAGVVRERHRIRTDGKLTASFRWAIVGPDAIAGVARGAGLRILGERRMERRHVVALGGGER